MNFVCETPVLADYLAESEIVDYFHPTIQEKVRELKAFSGSVVDRVRRTFEFVRDEIHHSWDLQSTRVTLSASEVLQYREGICYAKSHLLAALLRAQGIPTGFCYQRLTLGSSPESGYCVHALNAVFLEPGKWIRLDARGNKPGVQAEFSLHGEKLAFSPRKEMGEFDYPMIYAKPHPKTVNPLKENRNALEMYQFHLPTDL